MEYQQEREESLEMAREKVADAAQILEEILPEAAEELTWIAENIREEFLAVRSLFVMHADGEPVDGRAF